MGMEFDGYRLLGAQESSATGPGRIAHAVRLRDGVEVAIKVFDPLHAERAQREADIASVIDHPHILRPLALIEGTAGYGLVMPWMAGGSLLDLVDVRRRLRWPEALTVLIPLADALAAAHERGLVHGDVSAGNVLFDGAGRPVLTDFGASRAASETGTDVFVTPTDVAPEIVRGAAPTPASDLFSLGSVALMCLAGRGAWPADNLQDVMIQSAAGQWPELEPNMAPGDLRSAVHRLLEPEPGDRGSAAQVAVALRKMGEPAPVVISAVSRTSDSSADGARPEAVMRPATVVRPDAVRPPSSEAQPRRSPFRDVSRHLSWRGAGAVGVLLALVVGAVVVGDWWGQNPSAASASQAPMAPSVAATPPGKTSSMVAPSETVPTRTDPPDGATPAPVSTDITDRSWLEVVRNLDAARSAAFVSRDATLLSNVYTAGSAAKIADAQRIAALHSADVRPADARHSIRSAQVIATGPDGARSVIVVEDQVSTAIYGGNGSLVGHSPATTESTVVLHLRNTDAGYRIDSVEAG